MKHPIYFWFLMTFFPAFLFTKPLKATIYNCNIPDSTLRIIAHRGGASQGPENTMVLIEKALSMNVSAIEIDIRLTKDTIPVLMHDRRINRTTNGRGKVSAYYFEELRTFDAGSWFSTSFSGARIPSLSEVVQRINGSKELLIEIKGSEKKYPGISRAVVDIIVEHGAEDWCIVQSFDSRILFRIKNEYPQIRTHKLMVCKLPFLPLAIDNKISFFSFKRFHFAEAINPHYRFTGRKFVRKTKNNNMAVNVWGGKKQNAYNKKMKRHRVGIITDFPNFYNEE